MGLMIEEVRDGPPKRMLAQGPRRISVADSLIERSKVEKGRHLDDAGVSRGARLPKIFEIRIDILYAACNGDLLSVMSNKTKLIRIASKPSQPSAVGDQEVCKREVHGSEERSKIASPVLIAESRGDTKESLIHPAVVRGELMEEFELHLRNLSETRAGACTSRPENQCRVGGSGERDLRTRVVRYDVEL